MPSESKPRGRRRFNVIKASGINELWEMDVVGPMACRNGGHKSILMIIDVFSKRAYGMVIGCKDAGSILEGLKQAVMDWGIPRSILT
jgi:hypothetical protein